MERSYQLIIIGGGPAGLSAGLYASRSKLDTLLIEKAGLGGQILNAEMVENYPGFPQGISGSELGALIAQQATKYGLTTVFTEVQGIEIRGAERILGTSEANTALRRLSSPEALSTASWVCLVRRGSPVEEYPTALCAMAHFSGIR